MRVCDIQGVSTLSGKSVAEKSCKSTPRRFLVNLHWKRFNLLDRSFRLRLSSSSIRNIKKVGGLVQYFRSMRSNSMERMTPRAKRICKFVRSREIEAYDR